MTKRDLIDALSAHPAPDDTPVAREYAGYQKEIMRLVAARRLPGSVPEGAARLFGFGASVARDAVLTLSLE